MSISYLEIGPFEQIFTHVAKDGTNTNIASHRLLKHCLEQDYETHMLPVDRALAYSFIETNAVSEERVRQLFHEPTLAPVVLCEDGKFTDGKPDVFFCDGHHRYVLAAICKVTHIPCWSLLPTQWAPFAILDLPAIDQKTLEAVPPGLEALLRTMMGARR